MAKKQSGKPGKPTPWVVPTLNSRNRATVAAIFAVPTRQDVPWRSFEALIKNGLGGTITNGSGSRRRIQVGTRRANLHEPHPGPNMVRGAVEDARHFLKALGVTP